MANILDEFDGDVLIPGNLEVLGSINDADIAETLAAAQSTNSTAEVLKSNLDDMFSDGKLTPIEKLEVKRWWDNIAQEYGDVVGRAEVWGLDSGDAVYSDYTGAYDTLNAWLNTDPGPLSNLTITSSVNQATMRTYTAAYYAKKEALLKATDLTSNTLVVTAQDAADVNLATLADIADDDKVTPDEKLTAKLMWDIVVVEGTATTGTIPVQALVYSIDDSDFDTAYAALDTYLNTTISVFDDMSATTAITRADWDTAWKNYYDARTNLIYDIAYFAPKDPGSENLVGYWPLNDTPDDFGPNGYHGELTWGTGGYENGKAGNAFHFDGSTSAIIIDDVIETGDDDGTVSCWINVDSWDDATYIWDHEDERGVFALKTGNDLIYYDSSSWQDLDVSLSTGLGIILLL